MYNYWSVLHAIMLMATCITILWPRWIHWCTDCSWIFIREMCYYLGCGKWDCVTVGRNYMYQCQYKWTPNVCWKHNKQKKKKKEKASTLHKHIKQKFSYVQDHINTSIYQNYHGSSVYCKQNVLFCNQQQLDLISYLIIYLLIRK